MKGSSITVVAAIVANVAIAVTKFVVAGITGSSAMLSEAIHSAVDTGNGVLLLVGLHRSKRPPSFEHPFGRGRELYFWSLIVAVLIFGLGGGMSIYEGIRHIKAPEPISDPTWNYIVIAAAGLFEGISFVIAYREFKRGAGGLGVWEGIRRSKDPSVYTVLVEDGAALTGLAVAGLGIFLAHELDAPVIDGAASVVIGALLCVVAVLLIRESRQLLIGEGVSLETVQGVKAIALRQPAVASTGPALTMYIGPEEVLLNLDLMFKPGVSADDMVDSCNDIDREVRAAYPRIKRISLASHFEKAAALQGQRPA